MPPCGVLGGGGGSEGPLPQPSSEPEPESGRPGGEVDRLNSPGITTRNIKHETGSSTMKEGSLGCCVPEPHEAPSCMNAIPGPFAYPRNFCDSADEHLLSPRACAATRELFAIAGTAARAGDGTARELAATTAASPANHVRGPVKSAVPTENKGPARFSRGVRASR